MPRNLRWSKRELPIKLKLRETEAGIELMVKASPGSRRNEIRGVIAGALKVSVTAVAEKGKANKAIMKLLSVTLGIPKSQIELVSGGASAVKKFVVRGITVDGLAERLSQS